MKSLLNTNFVINVTLFYSGLPYDQQVSTADQTTRIETEQGIQGISRWKEVRLQHVDEGEYRA